MLSSCSQPTSRLAVIALLACVSCADRADIEIDLERAGVTDDFSAYACPTGWTTFTNCQGPLSPFEKSGSATHATIGVYVEDDRTRVDVALLQSNISPPCYTLPLDLSKGEIRATVRISATSMQLEDCTESGCGDLAAGCPPP